MKQLKLFSALLMCLFALSFAACSKDDNDEGNVVPQFEKENLYGGWVFETDGNSTICDFSEDGSCILVENATLENYNRRTFTYRLDNAVTTLTLTDSKGNNKEYVIISLGQEQLVLENSENSYTFERYDGNIDEQCPKLEKKDLEGIWKPKGDEVYYNFLKKGNKITGYKGVLINSVDNENYNYTRRNITYKIDEEFTTLTITIAYGNTEEYTILSFTKDLLVVENSEKQCCEFERYDGNIDEEYPAFAKSNLHGSWKYESESGDECFIYNFSSINNKGALVDNVNEVYYKRSTITYGVDNNEKPTTITITDSKGTKEEYAIIYLTKDLLVVENSEKQCCEFERYDGNIDEEYPAFVKSNLHGSWKYESESGDECFIYNFLSKDSKGALVDNVNEEYYKRSSITYSVDNEITTLTITDSKGNNEEYTILSLTKEQLVVENSEKQLYTFTSYAGKIDEEYPAFEKIYDSWKYESESGDECFIYYFSSKDSIGALIDNVNEEYYKRSSITYSVDDEITTLTITDAYGNNEVYTILSSTKKQLVVENSEKRYKFERYISDIDKTYPAFEKISGTWNPESSDNGYFIYNFLPESNIVELVDNAESEDYYRSYIAYSVDDEITTLTITDAYGNNEVYTILSSTKEQLVVENSEKQRYKYVRYDENIDEKYPKIYGYDAVNLGLSVKWATCNVGADSPEQYGDYFAWGEIEPKDTYTKDNSYAYNKNLDNISGNAEYDVVAAKWKNTWRMPTKAEMQELRDNCTWEWTIENGVKGYKVISKVNGNSIFLPAAGYYYGESLNGAGDNGSYWSSMSHEGSTDGADGLDFSSRGGSLDWYGRYYGLTIRPVTK